ncbi:MAG: TonB-dependent receptor [Flavobacteriales bacterium]|nr:TonB-dependent receptor [Flavobacteriales bacterium]
MLILHGSVALGQQPKPDTTILLKQAVVTAYKVEPLEQTTLNITPVDVDSLAAYGPYNLTDMLTRTPGVSALTTGSGISKPVIRGMYGNRVLVLISGLKFDNQQWQDEHGMGLSDIGLSRTEVIKGPMSVLYGSEALGGVINILEEERPKSGTTVWQGGLRFNSNTLGGLAQIGYKTSRGNKWWRIRAGMENNGDYSDGANSRVLNSRFDGYYLKASYGFYRTRWTSVNHLMSSYNRFGFIFSDVYRFIESDNRWSRELATRPAHFVILNMINSENSISLKNGSKLSVNVGFQSNERMENEGSGKISLDMHLLTFQHLIKWEKKLSNRHKLIVSHLHCLEHNVNYGSRKIVPNALMQESNQSVYLESTPKQGVVLENGIGLGQKYIHSKLTNGVNTPEKDIAPFERFSPYFNAFSGISLFPNSRTNVKFNLATGVRVPNLAELASNGLHEGIFTYEIGDPDLFNEQSICANVLIYKRLGNWYVSATPFVNRIFHYIYLAPTSEEWFGFPVYRYRQQHAWQYGSEAELGVTWKRSTFKVIYSGMVSVTDDGSSTPFVPAQRIKPTVHTTRTICGKEVRFFVEADLVQIQGQVAHFESVTPGYQLINLGGFSTVSFKGRSVKISLTGNNLLNTTYTDHLSRFKTFGIYNQGRNIVFSLTSTLTKKNS